MLSWSLLVAVLLLAARALLRQRHDRHRAEELLRLGQIGRLNTLGELAAGLAHELNQPLTAILASTQAQAVCSRTTRPTWPPPEAPSCRPQNRPSAPLTW